MLKQECEKVPGGFWGPMEHVTADQVYTMIADKEFSRKDFDHWVDIQPWKGPSHQKLEELSNDLQSMVVEPSTSTVGEQITSQKLQRQRNRSGGMGVLGAGQGPRNKVGGVGGGNDERNNSSLGVKHLILS
jgi:hypothetical protein